MSFSDLASMRLALLEESRPPNEDTIVALKVPSSPRYHLGLTHAGDLCALIEASTESHGPDVWLRNVEVRQGVRCQIREPEGELRAVQGSIIVCRASQPALQDLFLRIYADAIEDLGAFPHPEDIAAWLAAMSELLSKLELGGRRRLQGLWAELLAISEFGDPMVMLRRWRPEDEERFDFLGPSFAVEVKSCQEFDRVHEFSLQQLRPPDGLEVWVASTVVRQDPDGMSVLELLSLIESKLPDAHSRGQLRTMALSTAGPALADDDEYRFDYFLARDSVRLMDARAIPSISEELHADVVSVRLRVKCESLNEVGGRAEALRRLDGLR